ncbi:MAG: Trm112 family protein [Armatimonadota bacterium]|nr:Trm112 family protein [Armatimonadota bacterium]
MTDEKLLEILACPACDTRPPVKLKEDRLVCVECRRAYPIRDGIPVLLVEEATIEEENRCESGSSTDQT